MVAGVVPAAARRLSELANASVNSFSAAIGPCIGFDRFEVGAEVLTAFVQLFGTNAPIRPAGDKGYVDLREAVRLQLMGVGMTADKIDTTDRCTFRDGAEFFSHRRDAGITGRMAAIIGPRR